MPSVTLNKGNPEMAEPAEETEHLAFATEDDEKPDPNDTLERAIGELQDVVSHDRANAGAGLSATLRTIPLEVQAVIGRANMSVAELNQLETGSTVALNSRVGDPVDIFVNGVKVATGQMQVSEEEPDRFAFKVIDVFA